MTFVFVSGLFPAFAISMAARARAQGLLEAGVQPGWARGLGLAWGATAAVQPRYPQAARWARHQ